MLKKIFKWLGVAVLVCLSLFIAFILYLLADNWMRDRAEHKAYKDLLSVVEQSGDEINWKYDSQIDKINRFLIDLTYHQADGQSSQAGIVPMARKRSVLTQDLAGVYGESYLYLGVVADQVFLDLDNGRFDCLNKYSCSVEIQLSLEPESRTYDYRFTQYGTKLLFMNSDSYPGDFINQLKKSSDIKVGVSTLHGYRRFNFSGDALKPFTTL